MNVQKVPYESPHAHENFTQSLRETGFAVLTDHPIPHQLIFDVYGEWMDFFNSEEKHRYTFDPKIQSGYFPFRSENAKGYTAKDLKEFFHLYPWSQLPKNMSDHTWHLFKMLNGLAKELLGWIEQASPEQIRSQYSMPLNQMVTDSRETLLRILHYPPLTGTHEEGAIRAAAHEDINLITLLVGASADGLQVMDVEGTWHDAKAEPHQIMVNVGDMLQRLCNNKLKSTTHRVVNPPKEKWHTHRYSIPFFLHPRSEVRLDCLENCVDEQHPLAYAPISAGEYLDERLREIGLKK